MNIAPINVVKHFSNVIYDIFICMVSKIVQIQRLKRQYHEIFELWFFFINQLQPLINTLKYFRIRGAIRL
jgi:hypothetical protein